MKAIKPRLKILLISAIVFAFMPIVKGQYTLPFYESFDAYLISNAWTVEEASGGGWRLGNTSINSAAFDNDVPEHTENGGYYAWLDFSATDDSAVLESPTITVTNNVNIRLAFWQFSYYSNNANNANWLYIEAYNGVNWDKVDSIQQNYPNWVRHSYDLSSYKYNGDSLQFRFRAESGGSSIDYYNDILIDDIQLYEPLLNNLAMLECVSPSSGTSTNSNMPITVQLKNVGAVAQNGFRLKYSIDDGVNLVSETYNGSLQPEDTLTHTFAVNANMSTPGYYNVQTIVSNNGDTDATNDTIFTRPYICQALAGTYTLGSDPNDDFASFNEAIFALSACGISAAVVINIDSGMYNEKVSIAYISGSSATNTITFQSASGNASDVVLEYTTADSYSYTLELDGAEYITIKNITINHISTFGNNNYSRVVFLHNQAKFNNIRNNIIKMPIASSSTHEACVRLEGANVDSNLIYGNLLFGGHYGVYMVGQSTTTWAYQNTIDSNECSHNYSYGIYTAYQYALKISRNYIHDMLCYQAYAISNKYVFSGFVIEKNNIQLTGSAYIYGIYNYYCNRDFYKIDTISGYVQNNFISITSVVSFNYGIYTYFSDDIIYANNTINITGSSTGSKCVYQETSQNIVRVGERWYNNIFANNAIGYAAYYDSDAVLDLMNNNCYYTNGINLAYYNSNKTSLLELQAATSEDQNSIAKEIIFISNIDLHVNNIDINSAAMPLSYIVDDIDGENRTTTPDIGADEFIPIHNDVGIIDIEDIMGMCANSNVDVTVTVCNFGIDTITSGNIIWEVNGVSQLPYAFTGNIPPQSSVDYQIGSITMLANTQYDVKAWTINPNGLLDENNNNDTTIETGFFTAISGGTYSIGPNSTYDYLSFTEAAIDLNSRGICGSVIFEVADGIYHDQLYLDHIMGTSPTSTVTFKSASNNNTAVELIAGSSDIYTIKIDGSDYINIYNMTIRAINTSYTNAIELNNEADYNNIDGNIIFCTNSNLYSKAIFASMDYINEFNTVSNNTVIGGYYGIYLSGINYNYTETGNKIFNNELYNQEAYGIYAYRQDSVEIYNNYVHDLLGSTSYGIYLNDSYYTNKIINNKVVLNSSTENYGLYIGYINYYIYATGNESHSIIANNMISIINGTGANYGIYSTYNDKVDYYYNSVYVSYGNYNSCAFLYYNTINNTTGSQIVNNIFINNAAYAIYFNTIVGVDSLDYNMYWSGDTSRFAYWSGIKTNLAELQAVNSKDINSTQENPAFVSTTNLHKTHLSPNDGGTPLSIITTDIDADIRNLTNPDRGADEWDRPANDIFLLEILEPVNALCGEVQDEIIAVVYNIGYNTQTAIPISVSGNSPNGPFNLSDTIASLTPGQKDTVVLGNINTLISGNYDLQVYSNLISDMYQANDSASTSFNIYPAYTVPFLENFETSLYPWDLYETSIGQGTAYINNHNKLFKNLYSSENYGNAYMQGKIGNILPNTYLKFNYYIYDYTTYNPITLNGDSIQVMISTDCNNTHTPIYTIDQYSHNPTIGIKTVLIPLSAYIGMDIGIGFEMNWANSGDYWIEFDSIIVTQGPEIDLGHDTLICQNNSIVLDAGSSLSQNYTYLWTNQLNGDTLGISQTLIVDTSLSIILFVENEFELMDSDTINIYLSSPSVYLGTDTTICIFNSITLDAGYGFASYLWSTNPNDTQQTVLIDSNLLSGTDTILNIDVMVIDNNGCIANDTIKITFTQCTSIDEYDFFNSAKLYPNPTNEFINFEIDDYTVLNNELRIIYLLDANGKQIKEQRIESNKTKISLENLPDGVYFVKIANKIYKVVKM